MNYFQRQLRIDVFAENIKIDLMSVVSVSYRYLRSSADSAPGQINYSIFTVLPNEAEVSLDCLIHVIIVRFLCSRSVGRSLVVEADG
ncbi:hypothetical protein Cni_G27868 [Canna indica]|uniref:Uncharacterized protein n=1 Tax=Canna indica TaxID=4628 RepID=A0AAQ3QNC0_9LILI|nr:hypothetical protein Cni_G27868 [Canna indica]